jgi:sulfur carrier protein
MKATVKLFATLRQARGKVIEMEITENTVVRDLLNQLSIENEEIAILLVNGKDGKFDQKIYEGDIISLFPPVGGG